MRFNVLNETLIISRVINSREPLQNLLTAILTTAKHSFIFLPAVRTDPLETIFNRQTCHKLPQRLTLS